MTLPPDHELEWDADSRSRFAHLVPAEKWNFFAGRVRPLGGPEAAGVWDALFAGVGRPFHWKAVGWYGKLVRRLRPKPAVDGGPPAWDELAGTLGWDGDVTAYLVFPSPVVHPSREAYASREVYAAGWAELLDCFRRGWVSVGTHWDTLVVCSDASDRVAVFLEGHGPYFARREERSLRA